LLIVVALFLGACSLLAARWLAAALLAAGLLTALSGLVIGVRTHGWVTGLDTPTMAWFLAHPSAEFTEYASAIARFWNPAVMAAAAVICGALLSSRAHSVIPGAVVVGTVTAVGLAETAIKHIVVRPRTPDELRSFPHHLIDTNSFPSGHVAGTAALLGILAVCVGVGRSSNVRAWLAASVIAPVLVVAVTRVYLGAHWLIDDIGGAVLAGVFVTLGAAVISSHRARSSRARSSSRSSPISYRRVSS
jgi:undecaprenyl-diphosphatase